jgi:hypothetical protein
MHARSQAQEISARYHDDSERWRDAEGVDIADALVAAGARRDSGRGNQAFRYTLPDGSAITLAGDGWDIGYVDCFCWRGAGHHADCIGAGRIMAAMGRRGGSAGRGKSKQRGDSEHYREMAKRSAEARRS